MIALLSLLIVIFIFLLISRIASMALMVTGLSRDADRFQVRSAYTGVGFTTKEAEHVVSHPVRRRIIMLLMLIGHIGFTTMAATIVLSIIQASRAEHWWIHFIWLMVGMVIIGLAAFSRRAEYRLNRVIAWGLRRWSKLEVKDYVALLQLHNGYGVSEISVRETDWLAGRSLEAIALSREGILVLSIIRINGECIAAPKGSDRVNPGDTLILYGLIDDLDELDNRPAGEAGDQAHQRAIKRHENH